VREVLQNGGSSVTRDYIGEFIFVNNAIDHLVHEEGRVAFESGTPRYEFFLKDHLGNVRQVIRSATTQLAMATMEEKNAEEEEAQFEGLAESRQGAAEHNLTPGGYSTAWLNTSRGRILGPARAQEVQRGDSVTLSVFGKYVDRKKVRVLPLLFKNPAIRPSTYSQLAELGQQYRAAGPNQLLLYHVALLALTNMERKPVPEAYMGYALYNADSILYESGKIPLSKKSRNRHEHLRQSLYIAEDGYMEAFLVNETSENVWYDEFSIQSTGPIVVQETHGACPERSYSGIRGVWNCRA
jgi:hypothetical protein